MPLTARCPCVMVLGKKNKKICRPLQCVGPPGKCPVCQITSPALPLIINAAHMQLIHLINVVHSVIHIILFVIKNEEYLSSSYFNFDCQPFKIHQNSMETVFS